MKNLQIMKRPRSDPRSTRYPHGTQQNMWIGPWPFHDLQIDHGVTTAFIVSEYFLHI